METKDITKLLFDLCKTAYYEGRKHQYWEDFPDVGRPIKNKFEDTNAYKTLINNIPETEMEVEEEVEEETYEDEEDDWMYSETGLPEGIYCMECNEENKLTYRCSYANGDEFQCRNCGNVFVW